MLRRVSIVISALVLVPSHAAFALDVKMKCNSRGHSPQIHIPQKLYHASVVTANAIICYLYIGIQQSIPTSHQGVLYTSCDAHISKMILHEHKNKYKVQLMALPNIEVVFLAALPMTIYLTNRFTGDSTASKTDPLQGMSKMYTAQSSNLAMFARRHKTNY